MSRRGLTMVEMLIVLAVLALMMNAVTAVVVHASRSTVALSELLRWCAAADAVLASIQHDITVGDFPTAAQGPIERVDVGHNELTIKTRSHGAVVSHRYSFDPSSGQLHLAQHDSQRGITSSLLLQSVTQWTCTVDSMTRRLTVTIEGANTHIRRRTYRAP